MSNGATVSTAMQLSRAIDSIGVAERESLVKARAKPSYGNVMMYVKAVAKTGGRIAIVVFDKGADLSEIKQTAQFFRNEDFEVALTPKMISITIPTKW